DADAGIVAPGVGVADAIDDRLELHHRGLLGFSAHPRRGVDVLAHGVLDVLHHLQRVGFRLRAESFFDERLAERLTEATVGLRDATAPARLLFLLTRERPAEEL